MSEGSTQVASSNGGGSNVSRWSLGLEHLLADPAGAEAFAHFLAKEFAAENIRWDLETLLNFAGLKNVNADLWTTNAWLEMFYKL